MGTSSKQADEGFSSDIQSIPGRALHQGNARHIVGDRVLELIFITRDDLTQALAFSREKLSG